MLFQMQILDIFSYVEMKYSKYQVKCFLFIPKNTKWKKELKLNTILLLKLCEQFLFIFICINTFIYFPFCIYLYFYFPYLYV